MIERGTVGCRGFGGNAIAGHDQLKIAHVRIVRGVENAQVPRKPCENQGFRAQMIEEDIELRRKEAGMFRLQHEIIVVSRLEEFGDGPAGHLVVKAMLHLSSKIGAPLSKIVIHVDDRNAVFSCAAFQGRNPFRGRQRAPKQSRAARKLEVVDHIDEEQCEPAFVRRGSMQVAIS